MELYIQESGKMRIDMVLEFRFGLMVLSMKVFGKMEKLKERENLYM
jgi:hypothetical protein